MIDITIELNAELQKFIRQGAKEVKDQAQKTLDELGIMGESYGKNYLTSSVQTNRLRSSWHWENRRKKVFRYSDKEGRTWDGTFTTHLSPMDVVIGTNVEYAWSANHTSRSKGYYEATARYLEGQIDPIIRKHIDV